MEVSIRPPDAWFKLAQDIKKFEPAAFRQMRREVKEIGQEGVERVQKTVRLPPPTTGDESKGSREQIATQTKVKVSFTKRSAGVRITTTGGSLGTFPAGYNKAKPFRHRVFGQDVWVQQQGRPFFGVSIEKVEREQMAARMEKVIESAERAIGARNT